jgi:hypothetical protein
LFGQWVLEMSSRLQVPTTAQIQSATGLCLIVGLLIAGSMASDTRAAADSDAALPTASPSPAPPPQDAPPTATPVSSSDHASLAPAAEKPLPGPKYNLLRSTDDFSYLDGPPGSYQADVFDPIKNIRLGDWRLSLGGSFRGRLESRTNKFPNLVDPTQDTAFLHRTYLHADLRFRKLLRFYLEGTYAEIEQNDSPLLAIDENRWDFYQYFADLRVLGESVPLTLRAGRQELLYGKQRLVSPLDWANTRRRFEGFKLFWEDSNWNADLWYVFPVVVDGRDLDHYDERQPFLAAYVSYKGIPNHGIDLYYFYTRNANEPQNAAGDRGSLNLNTLGGRFFGKTGPWDYDTELTGQFGSFAGDVVQAWSWTADGGYTLKQMPWSPRLGLGLDYASGDKDPFDRQHQTFNQIFPLGHAYLGIMDFIARQNIRAGNINLTVNPHKKVTAQATYLVFCLDSETDSLFNAAGASVRRDPWAQSGARVGQELDLVIDLQIDTHQKVQFGYAHFWNGAFVRQTGLDDDADFLYVQYEVKF